jgi:hypothetical protein
MFTISIIRNNPIRTDTKRKVSFVRFLPSALDNVLFPGFLRKSHGYGPDFMAMLYIFDVRIADLDHPPSVSLLNEMCNLEAMRRNTTPATGQGRHARNPGFMEVT